VTILVTGGGGYLGTHLVRRLVERGERVRVLGRSRYPHLEPLGVEAVQGDVRDADAVRAAADDVQAIFHVASRVGFWGPHEDYRSTNVDGTQNVIDAARAAGARRLVYTSTPSVVIGAQGVEAGGDASLPYPDRYLSSYGPTKAEAERRVLAANGPELATVSLRPHFIFGPQDPQVVGRLLAAARAGRLAQIGDGSNRVDVTYVDTCVDAHVAALDELAAATPRCAGRAYFLGQESPVRLWDFVGRVLEGFGAPRVRKRLSRGAAYALGAALELAYRLRGGDAEPPLTRLGAIMLGTEHFFDHAAAGRDFGHVVRVGLDEALARTFAAGEPPGAA
jgi:nucleoside-diphosphate-sugar epimerase